MLQSVIEKNTRVKESFAGTSCTLNSHVPVAVPFSGFLKIDCSIEIHRESKSYRYVTSYRVAYTFRSTNAQSEVPANIFVVSKMSIRIHGLCLEMGENK